MSIFSSLLLMFVIDIYHISEQLKSLFIYLEFSDFDVEVESLASLEERVRNQVK